MKKLVLLLIITTVAYSCKSQNLVPYNTLTINGDSFLGSDKNLLNSKFGTPLEIEKKYSEMDEQDMFVYWYDGIKFTLINEIIESFEIWNSNFLFTKHNIKIGDSIHSLQNVYPISYSKFSDKHLSIQIDSSDMYVSFHFDNTTKKIVLIRIGTY